MLSGDEIQRACRRNEFVVRVHDSTSTSQLTERGFEASNPKWSQLPNTAWGRDFKEHYRQRASPNADTVGLMEDHILAGWNVLSGTPTNFISSSEDLEWVVWEVARRLARRDTSQIQTTVIRSSWPRMYRGNRAVGLKAFHILPISGSDSTARDFAVSSQEVLWYGRIFSKDIIETNTWTEAVYLAL